MAESRQITMVLKENFHYPVHVIKNSESERKDLVKYFIENVHKKGDKPFAMMDLGQPLKLFKTWNESLPSFKVYYAVKSNHDPLFMAVMAANGSSFDCASLQEMKEVLDLGVDPERVIFTSPAKAPSHISYAASKNIHLLTFSCESELEKIASLDKHAQLLLRIAAKDSDAQWQFRPTEKFGANMENGKQLLHKAKSLGIEVVGTTFHLGVGVSNPKAFEVALQNCSEIFIYGKKLGFNLTVINIGGGFKGNAASLSELNALAVVINASIKSYFKEFPELKLIAEPGSFFSTSSFIICLKVLGKVKEEREGKPIITYTLSDGKHGMLHFFERIYIPQIFQVQKGGDLYSSDLWGPTCSNTDNIIINLEIPEMQMDDWIWIEDLGSYSTCMVTRFNGFPKPDIYYYIQEDQLQVLVDMVKAANLKGFQLL